MTPPKQPERRIILDLCGGTGAWSAPYREAGYNVQLVTLPEQDVRLYTPPDYVHGVLAAPPCTCFSYARNRYPAKGDELAAAIGVVAACLRVIAMCQPKWWALENPVNLLRRHLGEPQFKFSQWEFGDPAEKRTGIWGRFTEPTRKPGRRTKPSTWNTSTPNAHPNDAITPPGFARAFFEANP